jgi:hypothetical protein
MGLMVDFPQTSPDVEHPQKRLDIAATGTCEGVGEVKLRNVVLELADKCRIQRSKLSGVVNIPAN